MTHQHPLRMIAGITAAAILMMASTASAAPLGLDPTGLFPDLTTDGTIDYNSSTGTFTVTDSGVSVMLLPPDGSSTDFINVTSYSLTAEFGGDGVFDSGTVSISGSSLTANPDFAGPNILTADLVSFGFGGTGASGVFEFLYASATGDMAVLGGTTKGGIIISTFDLAGSGISAGVDWDPLANGNPAFFGSDFSGTVGSADTFVPVPAAVWLFGSGLLGLFGFRRLGKNSVS